MEIARILYDRNLVANYDVSLEINTNHFSLKRHNPMRKPSAPLSRAIQRGLRDAFQSLHHVRRCLRGMGNLPAFILHHDESTGCIAWWELLEDERKLRPFDFEFLFHIEAKRDRYHADNLAAIRRTKRPTIGTLHGLCDLYVPLEIATNYTVAFIAGQWAPQELTSAWLSDQWHELSGQRPSDGEPLFRRYVQCCLEVPVIRTQGNHPHPLLQGLTELALALGDLMSCRATKTVSRTIAQIRAKTFLPSQHDDSWVSCCIDVDGVVRPPWSLDPFPDPRIVEELGLSVRPSVIALLAHAPALKDRAKTRRSRASGTDLDEMVARRAFQLAAVSHARAFDDWVAAPLGDSAVILALGRPARRARHKSQPSSWFVNRVSGIEQHLRRLGHPCVSALGSEIAPGEPLGQSYREAVALLERELSATGSHDAVHNPTEHQETHPLASLVEITHRVTLAFELRRIRELRIAARHYALQLHAVTCGSPEAMSMHIQLLLHGLLDVLERQEHITHERRKALQSRMCKPWFLHDASNALSQLESHLNELIGYSESATTADRRARLQLALTWLKTHITHPEALEETARRAGLAISSFRRQFRHDQGQAFASWLRQRKVEEAARILRTTNLSVREVAMRVGFGDSHRLIRAFRRKFGETPERYRRAAAAS